jgi:hypothetical protein
LNSLVIQAVAGAISIVLAEVVRDCYHLAGHYWQPLMKPHNLHHKAYKRDLSIVSLELYKQAQWYNDVPEALAMVGITAIVAALAGMAWWVGVLYSLGFLVTAAARSCGWLLATDLTHKSGDLQTIPSRWKINRTYHWRHHFDRGTAYFGGHFTLVDWLLGTTLSLNGKTIAITGASGTMGRALIAELRRQGAKIIALTTNNNAEFADGVTIVPWTIGEEADLRDCLRNVDICILNHGLNFHSDRSVGAIKKIYEVNTFSTLRLAEVFLSTVTKSEHKAVKELWINTSEAEVNPAFSPLYELSKRTLGDSISMLRLDAPCLIRKLILGPFKSNLNPYGVMSADWVARTIVALAKRDYRNIIVTINPLTFFLIPINEISKNLYFKLFTKKSTIRDL